MSRFPHLWQSIFIYSLVLILVSLGMGDFFRRSNDEEVTHSMALGFINELQTSLEGRTDRAAAVVLSAFTRNNCYIWLENDRGELAGGKRPQNFIGKSMLQNIPDGSSWDEPLTAVSGTQKCLLLRRPLALANETPTLYVLYPFQSDSPARQNFYKELFTIAAIASLLALWMAYTVGRPLRQLQKEVWQISDSIPLNEVSVTGNDEIAHVALAVNRLIGRLNRYFSGINKLISNISHELRSPLARMALSLEMVSTGLDTARENTAPSNSENTVENTKREQTLRLAEKHLINLKEEVEHMDRLIGKTLLFGSLESRSEQSLSVLIPLSDLCTRASFRYETAFRQAGLRFNYTIEPGIFIQADETLITQVISNLLDNAIKYADAGEHPVCLDLSTSGDKVVLTVENTCAPLPHSALEHLFEPFYRHEQNTGSGVGIGLSLVQRIAAFHKGNVKAESTEAGLKITVRLPLQRKQSIKVSKVRIVK